jgi:hypothetical protein
LLGKRYLWNNCWDFLKTCKECFVLEILHVGCKKISDLFFSIVACKETLVGSSPCGLIARNVGKIF